MAKRATLFGLMALTLAARAEAASPTRFRGFCTETAFALHEACYAEVAADRLVRKAVCMNVGDDDERAECFADREEQRAEEKELCDDQKLTRLRACKLLGEARYDPAFEPERFDDPRSPTTPNPYYPLAVGNRWEYRGGGEVDTIEILNETKLMEAGVRCIVARDRVEKDGFVFELTDDWFASAKDGATWYCGEEVKDFETFEGDEPKVAELVSIDGSFKAGREGDKAGIIFLASPRDGDVYLEEFSLGNAEDVTEILSTRYAFGTDAELDRLVPPELATRFCAAGDCVMTLNYSLLEPGIFARKLYARGVGVILEIELDTDTVIQLTDCSFDPRCQNLPQP